MENQTKIPVVIGNKWSYIKAPKPIHDYLYEKLSYQVQGRYEMFTYSMLTYKGAFKTGLLQSVLSMVSERGYSYEIFDKRNNFFEVAKIVEDLPIGTLRDNQKEVVRAAFKDPFFYRGIIDAATNFGKNWVIASMVTSAYNHTYVAITIHRVAIFEQIYDILTQCGVNVARWGTYKKKSYRELGDITLIMYPSMVEYIDRTDVKSHLQKVGLLIVDEAHRSQAVTYKKVLDNIDAYAIYYLSGTPFTNDTKHDLGMIADSGNVIAKVTNQDLIDLGVSQRPVVYMHTLLQASVRTLSYADELVDVMFSEERCNKIKNIILEDLYKQTLISVYHKEHGFHLLSILSGLGCVVDFVHSQDPDRHEKVNAFKEGNITVLITTEILKEGVNIPNIRRYINAAHGKSVVWLKQFVGRLLRNDGINNDCEVHDFIDTGDRTRPHSMLRLHQYNLEGFETKIIN